MGGINDSGFQFDWIAIDSMLDQKGLANPLYFGQVLEEWPNIFGPEHKPIDLLRQEIDGINLASIGIDHFAEASVQAVHEPLAIERGDVGFVAC